MQAIIVAVCSFVLAVVFGKLLIPVLRALKAGQSIREIGPSWHNSKAGTPTMEDSSSSPQRRCARLPAAGGACWRGISRTFMCWRSRWFSASSAFSMIS